MKESNLSKNFRVLEDEPLSFDLYEHLLRVNKVELKDHPTEEQSVHLFLYHNGRVSPLVVSSKRYDLIALCRLILAELDPTTDDKILATLERIEADLKENR